MDVWTIILLILAAPLLLAIGEFLLWVISLCLITVAVWAVSFWEYIVSLFKGRV